MNSNNFLESVFSYERVVDIAGTMVTESATIRRFNEYYRLESVTFDTSHLEYKIKDPLICVMTMSAANLVRFHQFIPVKQLKRIAQLHSVNMFNMNRETLRETIESHSCHPSCPARTFFVFSFVTKPRSVEVKFLGQVMSERVRPVPVAHVIPTVDSTASDYTLPDDDQSHLDPPSRMLKESIIKEWQDLFSAQRLQRTTCAVCGKITWKDQIKTIEADDIDLNLLRNPDLPAGALPNNYNFNAYSRALLHPKGLVDSSDRGRLRVCHFCLRDLQQNKMPRFALSNWLYYGRDALPPGVKDAFRDASQFEKAVIARVRTNTICCRFSNPGMDGSHEGDGSHGNMFVCGQRGMKGNVIVTPLDVARLNDCLPPAFDVIRDTLCVLFVSKGRHVSREDIAKFSPVLVRKNRVKLLIQFLLGNNPHYQRVDGFRGFNERYLNDLFKGTDEEGLPASVDIVYLKEDKAGEAANSSYVPGANNLPLNSGRNEDQQILMENVGFTMNDDTPQAFRDMKFAAVQRCLSGKSYVQIRSGDRPVPDFNNPYILSWTLPHLDPWGIGGFHHPKRTRYISMEEQLSHMLQMDDLFESDSEFAFIFYNVIRKKNVSQGLRFSAPASKYEGIVQDIVAIDPIRLFHLGEKYRVDPMYRPVDPVETKIIGVLRSLNLMAHHVPGSAAQKVKMRNEIRSLFVKLGAPTLFITLNPSDKDNFLVQVFADVQGNLEDIMRGTELSEWQRRVFAAKRPAACAKFFDTMIRSFIHVILRYGREEVGLYGKCDGYYGTVEAQGRGTLHCHMLVWLRGHPPPSILRKLLQDGQGYQRRLVPWLESIMQGDYIGSNGQSCGNDAWNKRLEREIHGGCSVHPGATAGPSLAEMEPSAFWHEFEAHTNQLLVEYNMHEHTATCWKYLARGEAKIPANCRVGITGEVWPETVIDPVTGRITVKKTHSRMTYYTDILTFLLKCNIDVKFIGAGADANAFMFYATDYMSKLGIPMHIGVSALSATLMRFQGETIVARGQSKEATVKAMTIAVNSMMGRQEISHQQVMSYLVGGGDHYTHARFHTFNWGDFLRFIQNHWEEMGPQEAVMSGNVSLILKDGDIDVSNQRFDYIFRPQNSEFDSMNVYDFMSYARKTPLTKGGAISEGMTRLGQRLSGNAPVCLRFCSSAHPQYGTHGITMRSTALVPVLLGPSFKPIVGHDTDSEFGAMQVLVLMKPWRQPADLKFGHQTWQQALDDYLPMISRNQRSIINNIAVLAEAKNERDRHITERRQKKNLPTEFMSVDDAMVGDGPVEDMHSYTSREDACVYGLLDWSRETFGFQIDLNPYEKRLCALLGEGLARDVCDVFSFSSSASIVGIASSDEGIDGFIGSLSTDGETEGQINFQAHIRCMAKKRHDHITAIATSQQTLPASAPLRQGHAVVPPIVEVVEFVKEDVLRVIRLPIYRVVQPENQDEWDVVVDIVKAKNLASSYEQLRAFLIIARQIIQGSGQLLMFISGMGGTGKSHVIKAVEYLLERLGRRHELMIGAPTGIASVLIGGATLHSLIKANSVKADGIRDKLVELWQNVKILIIDEISMVGAAFFALLSCRLRIAKGDDPLNSSHMLGGISVICLGDLCQLKPPQQQCLFSEALVSKPSFDQAKDIHSLDAMTGAYIWRQFQTVVTLERNHRQSQDTTFSAVLQNIRMKSWKEPINSVVWSNQMYLSYLQQRILKVVAQHDPASLVNFQDAPIIVGHRVLRDALNVKLVSFHSRRLGKQAHLYYASDTLSGKAVPSNLQEILWDLPSTKCHEMLGRLPLFIGMKVMITENLSIHNGVVNGAEGTIVAIKYHTDTFGRRYADAVYVKVPGCSVNILDSDPDVAVLGNAPCSISFGFSAFSTRITAQSFRRRQIPILPAYSYTDYKSQGRTLDRCIIDLATAKKQGVYVMLSRVKTLGGLLILRWFSPTQIFQRFSEELRRELDRIEELNKKTELQFKQAFDVEVLFRQT